MKIQTIKSETGKVYFAPNRNGSVKEKTRNTFQFADNRPETVSQRKLQKIANKTESIKPVAQLYSNINFSLQKKEMEEEELIQGKFNTLQKKDVEEEELIQGKFNTIQKKEPEEEELLQGKFITTQLQEKEEEEPLQGKFEPVQRKENKTGLPDNLKSGIENLSGHSMDDVKVNYNSEKPAELQAHAYAQGTDIHVAPGQEKHLPHEAWHVVQQKQGRVRPTTQLKENVNINDDKGLEKEADLMGEKASTVIQPVFQSKKNEFAASDVSAKDLIIQRIIDENLIKSKKDLFTDKSVSDDFELLLKKMVEHNGDPSIDKIIEISNVLDELKDRCEGKNEQELALKEIEEELIREMETLIPKQDQPKDAKSEVEELLGENKFRINSDLKTYGGTFGDSFTDTVKGLTKNQNWLDGGAGWAKPMQDLYDEKKENSPKMTAFSYEKPKNGDASDLQGLTNLEKTGKFNYVAKGKYFSDMDNEGFDRMYDLITDHNAVLMYTQTLSEDLGKYLNMLKPNGTMFLTLQPVDTMINKDAKGIQLKFWLESIQNVKVSLTEKTSWKITRDDMQEVKVPKLNLDKYETVENSNAPHREFSW